MNIVEYCLTFLRWVVVTIIIWYSWMVLHELSHSTVCMFIGGKTFLATILPHPSVTCENIVNESGLAVKPVQYFIYAVIPYVLGLMAIAIMYLKKIHVNLVYILVPFILLDTIWNYVGAFFKPTDFRQILIVSKPFYVISTFIIIAIAMISADILARRWKEFKEYGQKVVGKTQINQKFL